MADESIKDINNYFPKRLLCYRADRKTVVTVTEILSSLRLDKLAAQITFDGWEQEDDFNEGKKAIPDYNFSLSAAAEDLLPTLQTEAIRYMTTEAAGRWSIDVFVIDMQEKMVNIQIRSTDGRTMTKLIEAEADFDELVAGYPAIVGAVETFAWTEAQNHNVLKHFN